jgi:hypothetical protein
MNSHATIPIIAVTNDGRVQVYDLLRVRPRT